MILSSDTKRILFISLGSLLILILFLIIFLYQANFFHTDMEHLPDGIYYKTIHSPYGEIDNKLNLFYSPGNGTGNAYTRIEFESKNEKRNIYYQKTEIPTNDYYVCYWKDAHTVVIQDQIIDIHNGYYDYREEYYRKLKKEKLIK